MGLSKLQAVNIVLDAIGETPVSSLSSGLPDAEAAEAKIDEISKSVQAKGWHQNTDYKLKLTPDINKNIIIPTTYLRVDTTSTNRDTNVTVRKNGTSDMLYDIKKQVFTFDNYLWCDVVHHLDYGDLSVELSTYVAYRAARRFQEAQMASVALDNFTMRAEMEAYAALMDAETENEDSNILTDNAHCYYATHRSHRLHGY
tara:strand:- start:734 stop:1333 length:600 start_codon:yes stop_codon:yes gene_type:complete